MNQIETQNNINKNNNKDNNNDNNKNSDGGLLITIIFYIFGIGTLIGTNGMLNQLNFVEYFQKRSIPSLLLFF